jgi:universal stress protein A
MPIQNILVATDFSADSAAALDHALVWAKHLGARVHLLHSCHLTIQTNPPGFIALPQDVIASVRSAAQARLQELANKSAEPGVPLETHLSERDPVNAILEYARSVPADLIVVGTRGLTGLKHVLLGSVAERTVRLAACPVLTVKTPAAP